MAHRNARLTPVIRAELVERVTDGWPQAEVARLFRVSPATVAKWVRRFREGGPDALYDRSSRPLRSPRQTRSVAGSSHLRCTPVFRLGGHTASGGGWASPAPPPRVDPSHHRPSGPTYDRTTPTASGSTRCLGSLGITITGVHTAASAGLLPPPACKQRPWEQHLAVGAILSFPSSFAPVELGAMPARAPSWW